MTPDNENIILSDNEDITFGSYLRQIRLDKEISLEEVSYETKIGINMLKRLEAEDHQNLPEPVYVKSFLRSYAHVIGADTAEVVRLYQTSLEGMKIDVNLIGPSPLAERRPGNYWVAVVVSALCVIGLIYWIFVSSPDTENEENPQLEALHETAQEIDPPMSMSADMDFSEETIDVGVEKYLLKITAVEKTWLKIIVDGESPKEYSFKPNDTKKLEAKTGFDLLIGNAGGLQLELNGDPLVVPGKSGQVVSLKLP